MSVNPTQGHEFRVYYLREDNGFNSSPNDSTPKTFGADATLSQAEGSNNAVEVFEPNDRTPVDIIERVFEGAWSVDFTYTNPWWLYTVFGQANTTDNSDGSYTHSWSGQDPKSIQIPIGRVESDKLRTLQGCVTTQVSIQQALPNMTQVSISGAYAEEGVTSPASLSSQPTISQKPMNFSDASLDINGTKKSLIQSGSVDIQNNIEMVREWGSRVAVGFAPRTLVPSLSFSRINPAGKTEDLEKMYGGSTSIQEDISNTSPASILFDNGESPGNGINTMSISLDGTFPDSYGESGIGDPEADIIQEVSRRSTGVSIDATNEVSTPP